MHLPTGVRNIPQGHQHPPEATETFTFSVEEARKKTVKEFREMLQQRLAQDSSQRIHNAAGKRANAREALGQDEDHELLSELRYLHIAETWSMIVAMSHGSFVPLLRES